MADEEKTEATEQAEEPEAQADEQAPEAEEAPAEEQAPEADEAPAEEAGEETPAEEPAEDAPAEEPADEEAAAAEDEPAQEPVAEAPAEDEDVDWKTRRRLERSRRPAEVRPQRSPEERQSERRERRRAGAVARRRHRHSRRAKKGEPGTGTPPAEPSPNPSKVRQGIVVSDKADKTITVRIDIARRHPAYEKIVRRSRTLHAHDERNEAGQGDVVRVVETRPLSRTKRWRLLEVVEKAR
jgi:small subunit ribosomal protein S17